MFSSTCSCRIDAGVAIRVVLDLGKWCGWWGMRGRCGGRGLGDE